MKIIPIDENKITLEQLCKMIEAYGGYYDGDLHAVVYEEKGEWN